MRIIKLYLLRARCVKGTRRNQQIALIIFIGVIFRRRDASLSRHVLLATETLVNTTWYSGGRPTVCPAIVYPKNAGRIPDSKFDTWHPTNWLGYRIVFYFSCYRTPRARFTSSVHAGRNRRRWSHAVKSGLLLSCPPFPIPRVINVSWAGDSRGWTTCMVSGPRHGETDRYKRLRKPAAHGGYEILSNTHSVPGKPRRSFCPRNFRFSTNNAEPQNRSSYSFKFDMRTYVRTSALQMKFEYLKTIALR